MNQENLEVVCRNFYLEWCKGNEASVIKAILGFEQRDAILVTCKLTIMLSSYGQTKLLSQLQQQIELQDLTRKNAIS